MREHSRKFSDTDTYILHTGLKWIEEAPETFAAKLYQRLLRDHPECQASLHTIGLESFNRNFIHFLKMVKEELLERHTIHVAPREFLALHALPVEKVRHSNYFIKMGRTFLDIFAELAEDAWSPALESTWNKAIEEVKIALWNPPSDGSTLATTASPVSIIRRRKFFLSRAVILFLGTLIMVAGGMISQILWNRCRRADLKRLKPPVLKKAWSG